MPVRKVKGGYQWGKSGKVYPTRAQAERQAKAAYASGYKKKKRKKTKTNKTHKNHLQEIQMMRPSKT